ncbi:MAG: hypothetical protein IH631_07190, partial [Candidatus Thorarchaeota archaeon]|nr:hypothetical protein [Candidatus Thorarchaeota archaeon]
MSGFYFAEREFFVSNGRYFKLRDGSADTSPTIPADFPLQLMDVIEPDKTHEEDAVTSFEIVERLSEDISPKTLLPKKMLVRLSWKNDSVEVLTFTFWNNGETRDVFVASEEPWVLKFELPRTEPAVRNNCKNEWEIYSKNDAFRAILPKCHGYGELQFQGRDYSALLVDQVSMTLAKAVQKLHIQAFSPMGGNLIQTWIMRTVEQMLYASCKARYYLRDWHTQNLAFNEDGELKLIDWAGHKLDRFPPPKERMAAAMNRFIQHLPGPHTWTREDVPQYSDVELQHIAEWKTYMQDITDAVKHWWMGLVIPVDADLASLTTGLADAIANILSALEKVPSSGSIDDPAVPAGRGATLSSSSSSCHFPTQSVQRDLAVIEGAHLMPGQSPQLLRVLLGAARRQIEYAS